MPLDPVEPARDLLSPDNDPPFINESPNIDLVEEGLDVAEDERREAAEEKFVEEELDDDEIQQTLDEDFDDDETSGYPSAPELSAIHQEDEIIENSEKEPDFVDDDDEDDVAEDLDDDDEV